ncbi:MULTISPECIES: PHP domain-containing protein [Idiomarinaceae]|uniref:PHP domain-containing protein n=1 Tax=Pseudidiomarina fusca TaxID=2965078 RepID=A0ABU3KTL7_9GAMM|nr:MULTISPECIES: PHP domain-containing protein [Idiomarinaceae]MDT7524522.1 PHP domain-containing protein [Pseudidiomarina sp. GXY010]MRJ42407.1 PHP domain-containing protein [Idiomarina sp. FeN1]NCU58021.1 PHP domain-containing protein [Idiomarina sp. FenA--70]NCU60719.1 PHP domain-containing protein [Idiomarina sp. FenBw--71]UUN14068.1 PHP domain-containing protein [Idiomarina loihiensis]
MTLCYDLHCHSNYSDGGLTPADLVARAHHYGVTHLAITDHDTIDALPAARAAITQQQLPLTLVNGVELTCRWQQHEIHLVGVNFDAEDDKLRQLLAQQQQVRRDRYAGMVAKLAKAGIAIEPPLAEQLTMPTRKHLAEALLEGGWVSSFEAAFRRYLGKGQQAYVAAEWVDLATAIATIKAAGGSTVLAHPHAYQLSNKWLRRLLQDAKADNLDALEVAIGAQSPGHREALATFASEIGLLASAGSDFHNPGRWRELGKNLCLPAHCVPIWNTWQ